MCVCEYFVVCSLQVLFFLYLLYTKLQYIQYIAILQLLNCFGLGLRMALLTSLVSKNSYKVKVLFLQSEHSQKRQTVGIKETVPEHVLHETSVKTSLPYLLETVEPIFSFLKRLL